MINSILKYLLFFIVLILLQILFFNNIQFSGFVNPYVYIMLILLLPVELSSWILISISFFTGLTVDFFSGTPGMHAGATAAAGFARPYILRFISPHDGYEPGSTPSMKIYGFRWFVIYTVLVVTVHHFILFYLEVFRFADFFRTFIRAILSIAFSVSFILLAEYYRKGS
jgi:rod shape-determining protein MreD